MMTKTIEQAREEFMGLMSENGFTPTGERSGHDEPIYSRVWEKKVHSIYYPDYEASLMITTEIYLGMPGIRIYMDGRKREESHRIYSSPKRAMNAIKEIVRNKGFDF